MLIPNPPYGERLGEFPALLEAHQAPGACPCAAASRAGRSPFCPSPELLSCSAPAGRQAVSPVQRRFECQLRNYQIALDPWPPKERRPRDFANRLRKNLKALEK